MGGAGDSKKSGQIAGLQPNPNRGYANRTRLKDERRAAVNEPAGYVLY
jgi:hypothetical protein